MRSRHLGPGDVAISTTDLWAWLLFSMRYMFGRMSYGPSMICQQIRQYANILGAEKIRQMRDEARSALRTGMDLDYIPEGQRLGWQAFGEWATRPWCRRQDKEVVNGARVEGCRIKGEIVIEFQEV